jgi:hypothetical protein
MSRPRRVTDAQIAEIVARYNLYIANHPRRIARDFGISRVYVYMLYERSKPRANSPTRRATQEGHPQHLGKGL